MEKMGSALDMGHKYPMSRANPYSMLGSMKAKKRGKAFGDR
jgi:hypothetical protein